MANPIATILMENGESIKCELIPISHQFRRELRKACNKGSTMDSFSQSTLLIHDSSDAQMELEWVAQIFNQGRVCFKWR